jgi:DNA-directed RNA polymerase subunit N
MIIPVKCFTCGTVLGDKYQYYCKEVRTKKKEANMSLDDVIYLTKENMEKTPEGKVLDLIGLKKQCCRVAMLTHVDIM